MFKKHQIDALFNDLRQTWFEKPEFERLFRDAHLGIAMYDAGRILTDIDARVVALIDRHKPTSPCI